MARRELVPDILNQEGSTPGSGIPGLSSLWGHAHLNSIYIYKKNEPRIKESLSQ